jgi:hypothetical protein
VGGAAPLLPVQELLRLHCSPAVGVVHAPLPPILPDYLLLAALSTLVCLLQVDNYIEGERQEMIDLYTSKGMRQDDAEAVIALLSKNEYKDMFVDIMMVCTACC